MKRSMAIAWVAVALACAQEGTREGSGGAADTSGAAAGAPADTLATPDTPAPWVEEIRAGIRELPSRVVVDPAGARSRAIELYVSRQEALERRWGVRGSAAPDSALAASVMEAEARFHDLLALLNRPEPPDSAAVAGAVAALDERLLAVLAASGTSP